MLSISCLAVSTHRDHWHISWPGLLQLLPQEGEVRIDLAGVAGRRLDNPLPLRVVPLHEAAADISFEAVREACGDDRGKLACPVFRLAHTDSTGAQQVFFVADRRLPIVGAGNFRDFGGYFTQAGQQVVWGKLYRSGQLSQLTDVDHQIIQAIGIGSVLDFRREDEVTRRPSRLPVDVAIRRIVISPGSIDRFNELLQAEEFDERRLDAFMEDINVDLAINHIPHYREMFEHLLTSEAGAVIHCSAGKDRTGFGAALVLSALGVSRENIMADYLMTNDYFDLEREMKRWEAEWGVLSPSRRLIMAVFMQVKQSYLASALSVIEREYDGVEAYLRRGIGLSAGDLELLRERLLYDSTTLAKR